MSLERVRADAAMGVQESPERRRIQTVFQDSQLVAHVFEERPSLLRDIRSLDADDPDWDAASRRFLAWCDTVPPGRDRPVESRLRLFFSGRKTLLAEAFQAVADPAFRSFCVDLLADRRLDEDRFPALVAAWSRWLAPAAALDLQSAYARGKRLESPLYRLFVGRLSWMKALEEVLGLAELRYFLMDEAAARSFLAASDGAEIETDGLLPAYQALRRKKKVPLTRPSDQPVDASRLLSLLEKTGFDAVMAPAVSTVHVVPSAKGLDGADGYFDDRDLRVILHMAWKKDEWHYLPRALFHETGHAVNQYLGMVQGGQASFDRYAAEVVFGDWYHASHYPAAYAEVAGQESRKFIHEAFAEDFRIFLEHPALLPPARLERLDRIFAFLFPKVDLALLRQRISVMYRDLHGKNTEEIQEPVRCGQRVKRVYKEFVRKRLGR